MKRRIGLVLVLTAAAAMFVYELAAPRAPLPGIVTASSSGRAGLLLLSFAALAATYAFLARAGDRRAAAYSVLVLATTPLWFVHARTAATTFVPLAAFAIVLACAGLALLDAKASWVVRVAALAAAAIAAAFGARAGLVLVAAIPIGAVAAAGVLLREERGRAVVVLAKIMLASAIAMIAAGAGLCVLRPDSAITASLVGPLQTEAPFRFHAPVARAAYALAPWSALVPFSLAERPRSAAHLSVTLAAALSFAAETALAPRSGVVGLIGTAAIAASVGVMLRGFDVARRSRSLLALGVFVVGSLVARDVALAPDRLLAAFGDSGALPSGHATAGIFRVAWWVVLVATTVALLVDREWLRLVKKTEALLPRGAIIAFAGLAAGAILRLHAYPELLAKLSPGPAFEAWTHLRRSDEPIGILGVDRRAFASLPANDVVPFADAPSASRFLIDAPNRHFLAVAGTELPRVNAAFRAVHGRNVPILAGRGGAVLLASSAIGEGEQSDNPLDAIVLGAPPPDLRAVDARVGRVLEIVGWELRDRDGRRLDRTEARAAAHVRVAVRVARDPGAELAGYCTFLHVDHRPVRFGAEHRSHDYPMALWREGDVVMDDFEITLAPHFRSGSYALYWGVGHLPCHDDRRMPVTAGPKDDHDRVELGRLEVR